MGAAGEETRNTGLSGLILATSLGVARLLLARPVSSMWSTTPATTSWSEPRPSSRTPSSPSMPLPSDSGSRPTTPCPCRKKGAKLSDADEAVLFKKRSKSAEAKYTERKKEGKVDQALEEEFMTGRVLASISSRPGQCGRADGYILEGKELEFYLRKIKAKKGK